MRDAAVNPLPGDYLEPLNAGVEDPMGPFCVSPEIHDNEDIRPLSSPAVDEAAVIAQTEAWQPLAASKVDPAVTGVTPPAAVAGATITVAGNHLTGATLVKVGATAATGVIVQNAGQLTAVVPAGAAGATTVQVTTPAGVSNAFAYVRGA